MKCKSCFSKVNEGEPVCGVCKIAVGVDKKELTKEETRRRYFCRAIRVAGLLTIIASLIWFMSAFSVLWISFMAGESPKVSGVLLGAAVFSGALFLWMLGVGLRQYKRWSFYGGMITYGIFIALNILRLYPLPLLLSLLIFYYIVNRESRAILLRKNFSGTVK